MHVLRQSVYEEESVQLFFRDTYSKLMLGVKLFSLSFLSVVSPILVHLSSPSPLLFQGFPRYSGKCWEKMRACMSAVPPSAQGYDDHSRPFQEVLDGLGLSVVAGKSS